MSNVEYPISDVQGKKRMITPKEVYDLEDRLIEFAVGIIRMAESLPKTEVGKHIAGQILRSGTSPAPNYGEAQGAESRSDFIHKMRVCLKELRETKVWLRMIERAVLIDSTKLHPLLRESDELVAIFTTSIKTAREKGEKGR